jgi:hypothetical protein
MIVRTLDDGAIRLITQNDHARLSGLLAAHWGNGTFAAPRPLESVVRAATFHDIGWLRYEALPRYDESRHKSPSFFEVPSDGEQLDAFQWGIDWLRDVDPYAGLLISRHRTGLWRNRYSTLAHPLMSGRRALSTEIEQFVARNEAEQARMLPAFERPAFDINFRLLQVWDLLSLYLCTAEPRDEYIEPVPDAYDRAEGEGLRLELRPASPGRIGIAPYPFDVHPLRVTLVCKEIDGAEFPDEAAFRATLSAAAPRLLTFEFV